MKVSSITELFGGKAAFEQFWQDRAKLSELEKRWDNEKHTNARWGIIRAAYEIQTPRILAGRGVGPYFLDWDFTPIEFDAWQDIRRWSLPFYPQYPVRNCFIDVADPVKKIGLELDGKAYHVEEKDRVRDARLWSDGWRIFRAPGNQCKKALWQPFESDWQEQLHDDPHATRQRLFDWALAYSEGLVWALSVFYYAESGHGQFYREFVDIAEASLDAHRYEQFPLTDEEEEYGENP